jgi:hypothetical protein
MTLELVAAFALAAKPLTPTALKLAAWAMDVRQAFLRDTFPLYQGRDGKGQGVDTSLKVLAELIDARSFYTLGKLTSINALAKAVGVSRQTVRDWRSDPTYDDYVMSLSKDLDWAKVDESAAQGRLNLNALAKGRAYHQMAADFERSASEEHGPPPAPPTPPPTSIPLSENRLNFCQSIPTELAAISPSTS